MRSSSIICGYLVQSSLVQSTLASVPYFCSSQSLAFLKCPFPKKPLLALRGDGCYQSGGEASEGAKISSINAAKTIRPTALVRIKCFVLLSLTTRLAAHEPQAMKTTPLPTPPAFERLAPNKRISGVNEQATQTARRHVQYAPPYLSIICTTVSVNSSQPFPT